MKVDPTGDGSEMRPADYFIKDYVLVDMDEDFLEIQLVFEQPDKITENYI